MKICKQCGKEKPEKEFPWLLQRICHDCHMWNAMHWKEVPWPKKEMTPKQIEQRKQASLNCKRLRDTAKSPAISTEAHESDLEPVLK